jgi:sialate O-acetylesterase
MVLQRGKPVAVWGWADAGETVSVLFAESSKSVSAGADGSWLVHLEPLTASVEPRTLTAVGRDGRSVAVQDVLVGEVWLGSGQSNMEMSVGSAKDFDAEKAAANLPLLRYYGESSGTAERPQPEGRGNWQVCTSESVRRFSATLYFFGRELQRTLGVPVGLIGSAAGATQIEYWIPAEAQCSNGKTKANYESLLRGYATFDEAHVKADYQVKMDAWKIAAGKAAEDKKALPPKPLDILSIRKRKGPPGGLYNGKIFNLVPYSLRGVLWYQGESNAGNPGAYHALLTELVSSWRALWKEELPFAWVQLPGFGTTGEGWPRMREAMLKALELPRTGMAVTIDIGDAHNIHPTNKQEVGRRLSLWALGSVYGCDVPATCGPLPVGFSIRGNVITVAFKHAAGGLGSQDGAAVLGFEVAGGDRQWRPAAATIEGDSVLVSSPQVAVPVAVRYGWRGLPECTLYNGAGLPASPFRTDEWPEAGDARN